ncbi:hypothetical protein HAX54_043018 [Datura stramonium]|uniref:Uncharacterized protein n=1 Tax=Datura stramonium TaxID=4076 RepID=A0ABS8RPB9_DATST|nr:hypothetical protein [Datura stramonium]
MADDIRDPSLSRIGKREERLARLPYMRCKVIHEFREARWGKITSLHHARHLESEYVGIRAQSKTNVHHVEEGKGVGAAPPPPRKCKQKA